MPAITIAPSVYRDRVLGGWIGMAAGATLGAAREGATDVGSLRGYHVRPDQAVASAHIDLQVLSLHALRAQGAQVDSEVLGAAWLRHVRYPWDSYGYGTHAMRRGMRPPMSGDYGNWFAESGWAAARSPVWGLTAPGDPQQAARRAYRDAVLDHSGEGVWAAMVWAALVSAAFVVAAPTDLFEVGLAMTPRNARIARAVRAALRARSSGAALLDARRQVLDAASGNDATDAAITLGLCAVGVLYGAAAFGPSLCTVANMGHDAPAGCVMAGALCGVLSGAASLPDEWKSPLGDSMVPGWGVSEVPAPATYAEAADWTVATGELLLGDNVALAVVAPAAPPPEPGVVPGGAAGEVESPAAAAADQVDPELIARLRALEVEATQTPVVMPQQEADAGTAASPTSADASAPPNDTAVVTGEERAEGSEVSESGGASAPAGVDGATTAGADATRPVLADGTIGILSNSDAVRPLWVAPPHVASFRAGAFEIEVDYGEGGPVIVPEQATSMIVRVRNAGERLFAGHVQMAPPSGWQIAVPGAQGQRQTVAPGGAARFGFVVRCPESAELRHTNALTLVLSPEVGPPTTCDIPMLAGHCWWVAGPLKNVGETGFDRHYEPEDRLETDAQFLTRSGGMDGWQKRAYKTEELELEPLLAGQPGVVYARTTVVLPAPMTARLVAHTNDGVRVWVNRQLVLARHSHEPYRPTLGYGPLQADVALRPGPNDLLVKAVADRPGYRLSVCVADREGRPLIDRGDTRWLPPVV